MSVKRRVAEIAAESAVGLLVVAGIFYWATSRPNQELPIRWVTFGVVTAVLFGYPIYWRRGALGSLRFWIRWAGLLLAHSLVLGSILISVGRVPLVFFIPTSLAEFLVIDSILERTRISPASR